MYMGNGSPNTRGPNATYIFHLLALDSVGSMGARVGSGGLRVGSATIRVKSTRLFRYQHVGIGNVNRSHWGTQHIAPLWSPYVSGFSLQWNIGYLGVFHQLKVFLQIFFFFLTVFQV